MKPNLDRIRHSAAHVLAMAAIRLFPDAKIGIGPVTKEGYYYDFEFPQPITWEDVKTIETEMHLIIQENQPFSQLFVPKEQAFDILLTRGQIYKAELLRELSDEEVSFFKTGEEFIDLCRGPHVVSTGEIGTIKLTSLSGAYWKNDQNRPQLQRISGTAFESLEGMKLYLDRQEAIKARDFRRISKSLNLTLGGHRNLVYTPGGTMVIKNIIKQIQSGIDESLVKEIVSAPVKNIAELGQDIEEYFGSKNRSYKELPLRFIETGRHELSEPILIADKEITTINTFVYKSFFQPEDALGEIRKVVDTLLIVFRNLNLDFRLQIIAPNLESRNLGVISDMWQRAGISQTQVIDTQAKNITINLQLEDSLDREWNLISCKYGISQQQFISKNGEFVPAEEITYTWIIEKLLAYYIEDQEGLLPMQLSPTQIVIIPITDKQHSYASSVKDMLFSNLFRVEIDTRSETMQSKIRDAELAKIPVIVIIGEKEEQNNSVSLRERNNREIGLVSLDRLVETIEKL